jgi:hypothetical protein
LINPPGHSLYYSNVLIALAAAGFQWQAGFILGKIPPAETWVPCLLLFTSTFAFYGLHDWYTKTGSKKSNPVSARALYWQKHISWLRPLVILSATAAVILAHFIPFNRLLWVFGNAAMLAITYTFPLLPFPRVKRWKNHPLLKLFMLTGVWTGVTIFLLPLTLNSLATWLFFFFRFCFMVFLSIPFDVRDAAFDRTQMQGKSLIETAGGTTELVRASRIAAGIAILLLAFLSILLPGNHLLMLCLALHVVYTCRLSMHAIGNPIPAGQYAWLDAQMLIQTIIVGMSAAFSYIR